MFLNLAVCSCCTVVSHCGFSLPFPRWLLMLDMFYVLIKRVYLTFFSNFLSILKIRFCFILSSRILFIPWIQTPSDMGYKYFIPIFVGFSLFNGMFWRVILILIKFIKNVQFIKFLFYRFFFWYHYLRDVCLIYSHKDYMFCSRSFVVLALTFRSLIYFELPFIHGMKGESKFIFLAYEHAVVLALSFLYWFALKSLPKINWP